MPGLGRGGEGDSIGMIVTIQYLRGIAAMLVVLAHIDTQLLRLTKDQIGFGAGAGLWGVDIFFVISGLIMYRAAIAADVAPGRFLLNRVIRIVPLYWTLTVLVAGAAYLVPSAFSSTQFDPLHLLASLLFLPWPNPAYSGYWPVLIPGWTLNLEIFFYGVVAVALLLPAQRRLPGASVMMCLAFIALSIARPTGPLSFYTNDVVLEFVFGLLIGSIAERRKPGPVVGAALVIVAVCAVAWHGLLEGWPRSLAYGVPAMFLVFGSLQFESWARRHPVKPMRYLGDISYSLYLTHVIALPAVTVLFSKLAGPNLQVIWAYPVLALAAAIAVAVLSYALLERPLTQRLRRLAELKGDSQPRQPAAQDPTRPLSARS